MEQAGLRRRISLTMPPVARTWSTSARIRNLSGAPMIRLDGLTKT
jgi:hypothetical protein